MPRPVLPLALILALATAACGGGDDDVELSQAEACKVVREDLTVDQIEERFGKPDQTQDFFGDTVVSYTRGDERWQFQVSAQAGAYRTRSAR